MMLKQLFLVMVFLLLASPFQISGVTSDLEASEYIQGTTKVAQRCARKHDRIQNRINRIESRRDRVCLRSKRRCRQIQKRLRKLNRKLNRLPRRRGPCKRSCNNGSLFQHYAREDLADLSTESQELDNLKQTTSFCTAKKPAPSGQSHVADINGDGCVNYSDVLVILGNFGRCTPGSSCLGDANGDGIVNALDIEIVLSEFGAGCQTNVAPVALDVDLETTERQSLSQSLQDYAQDPDSGPEALQYELVSDAQNGEASLSSEGLLEYQPSRSFIGEELLSYRVFDGEDYSDVATITVSVVGDVVVPLSLDPCEGLESEHIYPVGTSSFGESCPGEDSQILYVSSSDGDDSNSGESPQTALATLQTALQLARDNSPDWIVLKRGDTFEKEGGYGGFHKSGLSKDRPLVISAYGNSLLNRPELHIDGTAFNIWNQSFQTWSGIHLETPPTSGGTALRILAFSTLSPEEDVLPSSPAIIEETGSESLVLEDLYIRGFQTNIILQGINATHAWNQFQAADHPEIDLSSSRVVLTGGQHYLRCSAVQNDPAESNFILAEALLCNRDSDFDNGKHILCHQDDDEDCDETSFVKVKLVRPVLRDSVIVDAAPESTQGGRSQGMYASGVFDFQIIGNIFDNNGWYIDRNGDLPGSRQATIFNHNMYLQYESGPSTLKGNISSRASSHGLQARAGATLEHNVFMRNPLGFFVADGGFGELADSTSYVLDNVTLEGNDINDTTPRGFGGDHNTARQSEFIDNIFAHLHPATSQHNNQALNVGCDQGQDVRCSGYFEGNIVYGWEDTNGKGTPLRISDDGTGVDAADTLIFVDNSFHYAVSNTSQSFISMINGGLFEDPRYSFSGGTYSAPSLAGGASVDIFGDTSGPVSSADWSEEGASFSDSASYSDLCRTGAGYYYKYVLEGDPSQACAKMHDDQLYDDFMQAMRQSKQRFNPAGVMTTEQFLNYIRAGFDKEPVEF